MPIFMSKNASISVFSRYRDSKSVIFYSSKACESFEEFLLGSSAWSSSFKLYSLKLLFSSEMDPEQQNRAILLLALGISSN